MYYGAIIWTVIAVVLLVLLFLFLRWRTKRKERFRQQEMDLEASPIGQGSHHSNAVHPAVSDPPIALPPPVYQRESTVASSDSSSVHQDALQPPAYKDHIKDVRYL
ncbi:hypothetical protein BJV82DRAFT_664156 [Fennellomyces sp. T-0311]|nr:hypothetical protein BJV82DRAFT_664156 [Fennellomyces sp. T-0311]